MAQLQPGQWPPRSPYEAILTSPSGRKKLAQQRRTSTSPSPTSRGTRPRDQLASRTPEPDVGSDEEDEETLRLQLQTLQAKLKLKRLQNKKAEQQAVRDETEDQSEKDLTRASSAVSTRRDVPRNGLHHSKSTGDIQVLLSPERRPTVQQEQKSPGRILLGIDKGLTARDVSLRRPPSLRGGLSGARVESKPGSAGLGQALRRPLLPDDQNAAPISFNERMKQSRTQEKTEQQYRERRSQLQSKQSSRFDVRAEELTAFKEAAEATTVVSRQADQDQSNRAFSRQEILRTANRPAGGLVKRSESTILTSNSQHSRPLSAMSHSRVILSSSARPASEEDIPLPSEEPPSTADPNLFEGFSRTNLSTRVLPHSFVSRTLEDKTAVTLPVLLKNVKAPDFELPPELEDKDVVVFAIIAAKSEPRAHKQVRPPAVKKNEVLTAEEAAAQSMANENGNYMVFTLTDLKWAVELFIFRTAFPRWHKLQPGTLVALLNPTIMPPPKGRTDTGKWSLMLDSSDDVVLEIGTAKDLGWCKAKTRDGKPCNDWIDGRKTEFCEFHVNRSVEDMRRGRMEVQGMSAPFGPGGRAGQSSGYLSSFRGNRNQKTSKEGGRQWDYSSQSHFFMMPKNASAANLLDAEDMGVWNGSAEEQQRKLFAAQERERDIAQKLGTAGSGAGAEYLRVRNGDITRTTTTTGSQSSLAVPDAKSMGLRNNHAGNVLLSPLKRKTSMRTTSNGSTEQVQRKKTRFITEKGIREAGRESLGVEELTALQHDDDELDIV